MKNLLISLLLMCALVPVSFAAYPGQYCSSTSSCTGMSSYCSGVSNGVCISNQCQCPGSCTTNADCASFNTTTATSVCMSNGKCSTASACMYDSQCLPSGSTNNVCCGSVTTIGTTWPYSSTTSTVCNSNTLINQQYKCKGWTSSVCPTTWQNTPCGTFETQCGYQITNAGGSCQNPDAVQTACASHTGWTWASGTLFEQGAPNCAGDDVNETYRSGYSRINNAPSPSPSYAVCNGRNATGAAIGNECVYAGVCMNTTANPSDPEVACNGIDDDCDGIIDENANAQCSCAKTQVGINSKSPETYDGKDNDCNGLVDDFYDASGNQLALGTSCSPGQQTYCGKQLGVCSNAKNTCDFGSVVSCTAAEYGPDYEDNSALEDGSDIELRCDDLDNDCDGQVDEGCQATNLLQFDGEFYGCNLPAYEAPPFTPPATTNLWYGLTLKFEFMYPQAGIQATQNDVKDIVGQCVNKGSWYCDTALAIPRWDDAYKYSATKPVNDTKDNALRVVADNYPASFTAWPGPYKNDTVLVEMDYDLSAIQQTNACCPESFCFNGTSCVNSEIYGNNTKLPPLFMTYGETGYRCSQSGDWKVVSLKQDFYRNDTGYCTEDTECYAQNRCYDDGEWNLFDGVDRMCSNGVWTTRTKYVAGALLDYVSDVGASDYVLYCDVLQNALGEDNVFFIDYLVKEDKSFDDYLHNANCQGGTCINNVCVLTMGDSVVIGTSLNAPLNETRNPFYEAFGFNASTGDKLVSSFETGNTITKIFSSSRSGKLFYVGDRLVTFYVADSSLLDIQPTGLDALAYTITNPLTSLANFVKGIFTTDAVPEFTNTLSKIGDFDKIYFAQAGGRTIQAIQEQRYNDELGLLQTTISFTYAGFNSNISRAAENIQLSANYSLAHNEHTIYGVSSDSSAFDSIWPDLTAKVRFN